MLLVAVIVVVVAFAVISSKVGAASDLVLYGDSHYLSEFNSVFGVSFGCVVYSLVFHAAVLSMGGCCCLCLMPLL